MNGLQRIRLNGIDAPESWQACRDAAGRPYRCGKDAAFALEEFLSKSRPICCVGHGRDRYRRVVAHCFRADGQSVNSWLVRHGWAVDWLRYSKGVFWGDQPLAKAASAGVWRGSFKFHVRRGQRALSGGRPADVRDSLMNPANLPGPLRASSSRWPGIPERSIWGRFRTGCFWCSCCLSGRSNCSWPSHQADCLSALGWPSRIPNKLYHQSRSWCGFDKNQFNVEILKLPLSFIGETYAKRDRAQS
ncbi:thermonuclease family protein [Rhizobium laguerreae]|uniref:thermonuclease family protein n=1 Tax=Rhizobium laguerreae TaxID=1076926 RepID=UPI0035E43CE4